MISLQAASSSTFLQAAYRNNNFKLNDAMAHVASGKRLMTPIDDVRDFFHVTSTKSDMKNYDDILHRISVGQGLVRNADQLGSWVWDNLQKMKIALKEYYDPRNADAQNILAGEFYSLRDRTSSQIDISTFMGYSVMAHGSGTPVLSIVLDGMDLSNKLKIEYNANETVDLSGLSIGTDYAAELAALEVQVSKTGNFLARTSAYNFALDAYANMTNKKMQTNTNSIETMENVDSGIEMMKLTKNDLNLRMTVSMMAQSNMARSSVLNLLDGINGK